MSTRNKPLVWSALRSLSVRRRTCSSSSTEFSRFESCHRQSFHFASGTLAQTGARRAGLILSLKYIATSLGPANRAGRLHCNPCYQRVNAVGIKECAANEREGSRVGQCPTRDPSATLS